MATYDFSDIIANEYSDAEKEDLKLSQEGWVRRATGVDLNVTLATIRAIVKGNYSVMDSITVKPGKKITSSKHYKDAWPQWVEQAYPGTNDHPPMSQEEATDGRWFGFNELGGRSTERLDAAELMIAGWRNKRDERLNTIRSMQGLRKHTNAFMLMMKPPEKPQPAKEGEAGEGTQENIFGEAPTLTERQFMAYVMKKGPGTIAATLVANCPTKAGEILHLIATELGFAADEAIGYDSLNLTTKDKKEVKDVLAKFTTPEQRKRREVAVPLKREDEAPEGTPGFLLTDQSKVEDAEVE